MLPVVLRLGAFAVLYGALLIATLGVSSRSTWVLLVQPILAALMAFLTSRASMPRNRHQTAGLLLFALFLLPLDIYSLGGVGGDSALQVHYGWQLFATAGLTILLLIALRELFAARIRKAFYILAIETTCFITLNAIYVIRDGPTERFFVGYDSSPIPLVTVLLGVITRGLLLALLRRVDARRVEPVTP